VEVTVRIQSILSQKGTFVASIGPDATVFDASRQLTEHRVGALVVSRDGTSLDGILSERDVARSIALHGERAIGMPVAELMTVDVFTCAPQDTVDELMAMMTEKRVRHLPVVDESGGLLGIISIGDVVKHRVGELEQEARTLHEYIELGR
jgi:CBS domain-containing protein